MTELGGAKDSITNEGSTAVEMEAPVASDKTTDAGDDEPSQVTFIPLMRHQLMSRSSSNPSLGGKVKISLLQAQHLRNLTRPKQKLSKVTVTL